MDDNVLWYKEAQISRTLKNLEQHNIKGYFVKDEKELIELIKELIIEGTTVGIGDSMTLFETGVIDLLRRGNLEFWDKYKKLFFLIQML